MAGWSSMVDLEERGSLGNPNVSHVEELRIAAAASRAHAISNCLVAAPCPLPLQSAIARPLLAAASNPRTRARLLSVAVHVPASLLAPAAPYKPESAATCLLARAPSFAAQSLSSMRENGERGSTGVQF